MPLDLITTFSKRSFSKIGKLLRDEGDRPIDLSFGKKKSELNPGSPFCFTFWRPVYPNPAKELLNVSLNLNAEDKGILQIMDVKGRMVQESSIIDGNNQIKLNQLSNGLYIFHIRVNGKIMKTDKLMIH